MIKITELLVSETFHTLILKPSIECNAVSYSFVRNTNILLCCMRYSVTLLNDESGRRCQDVSNSITLFYTKPNLAGNNEASK